MKYTKILALGVMAAAAAGSMNIQAQNTRTGYFLDGYTYRYQMNPAFANDRGFVAMPALGNFNLDVTGTLGLKDVLYNVGGKTTTFLNPGVSTQEVLNNIGDNNRFGLDLSLPVLAFGFNGFGGYNTVTISAKASTHLKVPGAMFRLLKEGVTNSTYDIGAMKARAIGYAEVALGHSHKINDRLRVGANLKVLVGAGRANLDMKHADLVLGTDSWQIVTEGELEGSIKGLTYETKRNDTTGDYYVNGMDIDSPGVNGFGVAVDLGAVYTPDFMPELTLSASILDLGFMNWSNNMLASTCGERVFTTDKYTFNVDDDAPNNFSDELDRLGDDISSLIQLSDMGDQGSTTTGLGATFNIGAEYMLPMYKQLTVGLLNTTRINGPYSWTDFRLSANWEACRVFDASVSAGVGTFGTQFGWLFNLHCPGFNLFAGMDKMFTKVGKGIPVPLTSSASMNLGINFLF